MYIPACSKGGRKRANPADYRHTYCISADIIRVKSGLQGLQKENNKPEVCCLSKKMAYICSTFRTIKQKIDV
jgi:hypothetical protein